MSDKRICQLVGVAIFLVGCCLAWDVVAMEGSQLVLAGIGGLFIGVGGGMVLSPVK